VTRRRWIAAGAAAAVALAAWLLFFRRDGEDEAKPPEVVAVERGPVRETVSCTGRVVPAQEVEIKCKASGEVASVPYDVSDVVKKGALLVELDPVDEQRRVNQAQVALAASRAQVELKRNALTVAERTLATDREKAEAALAAAEVRARDARAKAERMGVLFQKKLASEEERDGAETAAVGAEAEIIERVAEVTGTFTLLLGGIAAISLLVGGIGITNIMFVTVAERTREIGIRKAIGARNRDILRQFLFEAVLLSGLGGVAGAAFGAALALALQRILDMTVLIRPEHVLLALSFSAGVGVFFGYYPARRAAQLDPIDALRYE
jgi:putative ABC transport system permease protein